MDEAAKPRRAVQRDAVGDDADAVLGDGGEAAREVFRGGTARVLVKSPRSFHVDVKAMQNRLLEIGERVLAESDVRRVLEENPIRRLTLAPEP